LVPQSVQLLAIESNMNIVAIDFSLNSPGIVVRTHENELKFLSYMKAGGTKSEIRMQEELTLQNDIDFKIQPGFETSKEFSERELTKLNRYITMAEDMIEMIISAGVATDSHTIFAFEGVSYGSGGGGTNNLIDLAAAAAIFKYSLLIRFQHPDNNILTVASTSIKKHAGGGRLKKRELWDVFVQNTLEDDSLSGSGVWKFAVALEVGAKVPKPFDDLVDAYFLSLYIQSLALSPS